MEEDIALLEFIQGRPEGNLLREIAERRLLDSRRLRSPDFVPSRKEIKMRKIEVIHRSTNRIFDSIYACAIELGVNPETLKHDIDENIRKYKVYRLT